MTTEKLDSKGRPLDHEERPIDVEAYEQEVYWRVRLGSEWEERTYLRQRGEEMPVLVRKVEMSGSYPRTLIRITVEPRNAGEEVRTMYGVWDPVFITPSGLRNPPTRVAGDMLVWARGG